MPVPHAGSRPCDRSHVPSGTHVTERISPLRFDETTGETGWTTRGNMMATTARRASDATTPWWRDICGDVDRRSRRRLRHVGTDRVYLAGTTIVAEGSRADRFSLILHGEVEVIVDGQVVNTLEPGEFFGEVALLYARPNGPSGAPVQLPRTATVRATRATRVRELDRAELMTLMDVAPAAASRISRRAIGRLAVMKR